MPWTEGITSCNIYLKFLFDFVNIGGEKFPPKQGFKQKIDIIDTDASPNNAMDTKADKILRNAVWLHCTYKILLHNYAAERTIIVQTKNKSMKS